MVEIANLLASLLTPLAIAFVGLLVQRTLAAQNRAWQVEDRLAGKRMEIYEKVAEDLNRIYCYVMDVGDFKDETPDAILAAKRSVDRNMFIYQAIWPEETFKHFKVYIDSGFAHFQGFGEDAKIRAKSLEKRASYEKRGKEWPDNWDARFTNERDPAHRDKYQTLMKLLSKDLMHSTDRIHDKGRS